jgi:hypothetical protein
VLAARDAVEGPFAVINADDFYGRAALDAVARFLRASPAAAHAVVGYRLAETASAAGGVNRAVLEPNADGSLAGIVEVKHLVRTPGGRFLGEVGARPRTVAADALVSMNLWGFSPAIFPALVDGLEAFLGAGPGENGEFNLPDAVQRMIVEGRGSVTVLPTTSRWCGLTYPADRPAVASMLRELVAAGEYPAGL